MILLRRQFLRLASAAAVSAVSPAARGQSYPQRPVHILVGYAPGGGNDIAARLIGQWLSERLRQRVVIENRPGAGSNIATEAVVQAPADGHTLLLMSMANAANTTLYDKLSFDFSRDIAPVAALLRVPHVVALHPSVPAHTLAEFIAYAKANPSKVNIGSGPLGGPVHLTGALFNVMSGLTIPNVPYRGEALALADLIAGQVQVVFASLPASLQYIRSGKVRGLAVTTMARADAAPELPTAADFVPGYDASTWYGIGAPKNTPAEIVDRLNREINAGLVDPVMKERLAQLGGMAIGGSPTDLGKLIVSDTEKWSKVIRAANITAQ